MTTIDDAILATVQSDGNLSDKQAVIKELITALPTDRWTFRWVIWGLIAVVLIPIIGVFVIWGIHGAMGTTDIPQGLISIASTAIGALAAFITPGIHQGGQQAEQHAVQAGQHAAQAAQAEQQARQHAAEAAQAAQAAQQTDH